MNPLEYFFSQKRGDELAGKVLPPEQRSIMPGVNEANSLQRMSQGIPPYVDPGLVSALSMTMPAAKPLWEMSQKEFDLAASKGKIIPASGKITSAEKAYSAAKKGAETSLGLGEAAGYAPQDIAAFYSAYQHRLGQPTGIANLVARKWLIQDSIKEGKISAAQGQKIIDAINAELK